MTAELIALTAIRTVEGWRKRTHVRKSPTWHPGLLKRIQYGFVEKPSYSSTQKNRVKFVSGPCRYEAAARFEDLTAEISQLETKILKTKGSSSLNRKVNKLARQELILLAHRQHVALSDITKGHQQDLRDAEMMNANNAFKALVVLQTAYDELTPLTQEANVKLPVTDPRTGKTSFVYEESREAQSALFHRGILKAKMREILSFRFFANEELVDLPKGFSPKKEEALLRLAESFEIKTSSEVNRWFSREDAGEGEAELGTQISLEDEVNATHSKSLTFSEYEDQGADDLSDFDGTKHRLERMAREEIHNRFLLWIDKASESFKKDLKEFPRKEAVRAYLRELSLISSFAIGFQKGVRYTGMNPREEEERLTRQFESFKEHNSEEIRDLVERFYNLDWNRDVLFGEGLNPVRVRLVINECARRCVFLAFGKEEFENWAAPSYIKLNPIKGEDNAERTQREEFNTRTRKHAENGARLEARRIWNQLRRLYSEGDRDMSSVFVRAYPVFDETTERDDALNYGVNVDYQFLAKPGKGGNVDCPICQGGGLLNEEMFCPACGGMGEAKYEVIFKAVKDLRKSLDRSIPKRAPLHRIAQGVVKRQPLPRLTVEKVETDQPGPIEYGLFFRGDSDQGWEQTSTSIWSGDLGYLISR